MDITVFNSLVAGLGANVPVLGALVYAFWKISIRLTIIETNSRNHADSNKEKFDALFEMRRQSDLKKDTEK